jgi:hypothetical protein
MGLIGTRIEWTAAAKAPGYGTYPYQLFARVRSGVVWSTGPVRGTAWVVPDQPEQGEGRAVCVTIRANGEHVATPADQLLSTADLQAETLHRLRLGWPLAPEISHDQGPLPLHPSRLCRGVLGVPD